MTPKRRRAGNMASGSCERRQERRLAPTGLHRRPGEPILGAPQRPFRVRLPRPTGWGIVPRYTYRRLAKLPSTADQLRRQTVLNLPGMLHGLSFEHTVMEPGAAVAISAEDDTGLLIFTI